MTTTSVALFLAREMGLPNPVAHDYPEVVICTRYPDRISASERGAYGWNPHTDRAQFADMLLWAWKKDVRTTVNDVYVTADARFSNPCGSTWSISHDNTDESIIAATLLAIAKARGYEDE